MGFYKILQQGQQYMQTWPLVPRLSSLFPENRVIMATQFAQKMMPFLAVFAVVWQQFSAKSDWAAFAIAVLTALFALLLPLQGLYWLGKRATMPLPAQSAVSFSQICQKLQQHNVTLPPFNSPPTYQDLAIVLKKAEQKLDKSFWQQI